MNDLILQVCIGSFVLFLLLVLVFLILRNRPFSIKKNVGENMTDITFTANKPLHKITVKSSEITFQRSKLKKGQVVDFSFPNSEKKTKIIVEKDPGKEKEYEV